MGKSPERGNAVLPSTVSLGSPKFISIHVQGREGGVPCHDEAPLPRVGVQLALESAGGEGHAGKNSTGLWVVSSIPVSPTAVRSTSFASARGLPSKDRAERDSRWFSAWAVIPWPKGMSPLGWPLK